MRNPKRNRGPSLVKGWFKSSWRDGRRVAIWEEELVACGRQVRAGFIRKELADAIYHCWKGATLLYPFPRPPIKTIPESIFARKILGLIDGGGPTTRNALLNIIPRRKKGEGGRGRRRGFVNVINHRSSRGIDQFTVSGSKSSKKTLQPFNRLITILQWVKVRPLLPFLPVLCAWFENLSARGGRD